MAGRLILALLGACVVPAGAAQEPVVAWFRSQAVPLKTAEAGQGFADMQPLKKMIGNARIVSLGEATHGTREFFRLKLNETGKGRVEFTGGSTL